MSRPALLIKFTLMIMLSVSFIDANDTNNTTTAMPWIDSILSKVRDRNITRKSSETNATFGITTFNSKSVYFWQMDQNATLKKEYEEHLAKERDFCTDFYDDLFK